MGTRSAPQSAQRDLRVRGEEGVGFICWGNHDKAVCTETCESGAKKKADRLREVGIHVTPQ